MRLPLRLRLVDDGMADGVEMSEIDLGRFQDQR